MERVRLFYKPVWSGPASIRDVLSVSGPLVISQLSIVLNLFFDRLFLSWYDLEVHMPASMSAGVAWWASIIIFMGVISYLSTFAAQYSGANRMDRVGASTWQALYICVISMVIVWLAYPGMKWLFGAVAPDGDGVDVMHYVQLQSEYCRILNLGALFLFFNTAISSLLSAMNKLKSVIFVSFVITAFNVFLNQRFIFAPPEWLPFIDEGLSGAAWGTMLSFLAGSAFYLYLLIRSGFSRKIQMATTWRIDWPLFRRMIRFGLPQGLTHFVEVSGFAVLMLVLGNISTVTLAAANIAFTINNMVFVPLLSIGQAVSILVGQYIGAKQIEHAKRIAFTGSLIGFCMVSLIAVSYVLMPDVYINIFHSDSQNSELFGQIAREAKFYLFFVACYALADVFGLIYSGALRGAGDTTFCMLNTAGNSLVFLFIPNLLALYFGWPAVTLFIFMSIYIFTTATIYLVRYWQGKWTTMTVMEPEVV